MIMQCFIDRLSLPEMTIVHKDNKFCRATVFTMDGLPQPVLKKFSDLGSDIHIGGPIWDICDATAKKYIQKMKDEGKTCHYIHPFDSPAVWDGHSTLIHEVMPRGVD